MLSLCFKEVLMQRYVHFCGYGLWGCLYLCCMLYCIKGNGQDQPALLATLLGYLRNQQLSVYIL